MKRITSFILAALFLSTVMINVTNAQPKLYLHISGGYSIPMGGLKGDLQDTLGQGSFVDFGNVKNYGYSKGWNINVTGRYGIDTTGTINATGGLQYNSFINDKQYTRASGTALSYSYKMNVITFALGLEYMFNPKEKYKPFLGLEGTVNFFSGKIEASGDTAFQLYRKNESRFGVNINGGVDMTINKSFGVILGVRYSLANMIGKTSESATTTTTGNPDTQNTGTYANDEIPLNDGQLGLNAAKSIAYLQLYAGVSYYFGYPLKYKPK